MAYPFRNLVFEGGGVKGIAYVGAMEVLQSMNILQNLTRVGSTSVPIVPGLGRVPPGPGASAHATGAPPGGPFKRSAAGVGVSRIGAR